MTCFGTGVPVWGIAYLLDGDLAVLLAVVRGGHYSVGTGTDLLYDLVFLVDDEGGAAHLV